MRIFFASAAKLLTDHRAHGEGLIAWKLLSGLVDRGHQVVACGAEVDFREPPPFEAIALGRGGPSRGFAPVAHAFRAARILRARSAKQPFDVVHWLRPGDQLTMLYPRALLAAGIGQRPLIVGPLGLPWPDDVPGPRSASTDRAFRVLVGLARPVQRRAVQRVTVLAATPDVRDRLSSEWQPRARDLPLGVDVEAFPPSPLPPDPVVLFAGTLSPYKGIRELVEAFSRVRAEVPGTRLVVVGDGPERDWVRARARELGVESAVELLGARPPSEMSSLLSRASVLASPSHTEAYGMAILEAMASARPVVATAVGGPRTLVVDAEGGRLVPVGSVEHLAAGLVEVLRDPEAAARMGAYNRARAEREFGLADVIARLERIYLEAAGGQAGRTNSATT